MLDFKDRKNIHAIERHIDLLAQESSIDYGDSYSDEVQDLKNKIQYCKDEKTFNELLDELNVEMNRDVVDVYSIKF